MATREDRFPMYQPVSELKTFIQRKKAEINTKIKKGGCKDTEKARNFAEMLEEILKLPYFDMKINVASALEFMKVDMEDAKNSLCELREKREEIEYRLEFASADQDEGDRDYPDFWEKVSRLNDLRVDLAETNEYIDQYERARVLIHRLQGIICRPKGFFANLK